ncbi:uncharacterized protein [Trachinotus anak]|uniref:uncharacterized protein n=1 Tax=Trachinotus anak TaxID=443729 RepID=UPI0039F1C062
MCHFSCRFRHLQTKACFENFSYLQQEAIMATLRVELLKILQDLKEDQFKLFKFYMKDDSILEGLSKIPQATLEKAERPDMVDIMLQKYQDRGALKVTLKVLEKIDRNDLVERLQNFSSRTKDVKKLYVGAQTGGYNRKKARPLEGYNRKKARPLEWVKLFSVDVTLDPDTAHPNLILSDDRKQVHHGDFRQLLPDNSERFYSCVNVLGKESFSSGRFYFEVQVKGKTAWTVGVAKESIKRRGSITLSPEDGFWTVLLENGKEYIAIDDDTVHLSLHQHPRKVGVFVDHEEGLVSFYDADSADHLYTFTGCNFTERLYPFFSPCTNDHGVNSAPLIISPVNHDEQYERKKLELKSLQQFSVDVTLDPDTAHPNLILSEDRKQVHCDDVRQNLPDSPKRFNSCVNVLGKESFSSGRFYFEVQVKGKTAWTVGAAKESIKRRGNITLSPDNGFWTVLLKNGKEYMAIDDDRVHLSLHQHPRKVGVFVDYEEGLVSFYDVEAADHLYTFTDCVFTERLYPFLSPCTEDHGLNSAPLIISPVNHDEDYERKKAELKSVQQFSVDVTLDPDTAHPNLILSDDGKQVHHGDVRKLLPESPERFNSCVNVLGKESFSSGRFYFEVQVKGKTAWTVGVAEESIKRRGNITLSPDKGFWTVWLRNGKEYMAIDDDAVRLPLNQHPCKVGVFVDYEDGLVSFYDIEAADLLYSFKGCSFTEKLLPYISPCNNDNGSNSAPLIICPVNHNDFQYTVKMCHFSCRFRHLQTKACFENFSYLQQEAIMATLRVELLEILQELKEDQFKLFKFYVNDDSILEGLSKIPQATLEKAERTDMVDVILQKYQDRGALKVTLKVLESISRKDLVERLQNFSSRTKDVKKLYVGAQTEGYNRKKARPLEWVQQFSVDVTLDPDTAHPNLILSDDGKQVHHGDFRQLLPDNSERFYSCVNVLGKESFSSGRFYFEVQVKGKTAWALGVAKESIKRKGNITASPENGYWTVMLRNRNEYEANDEDPVHLSLNQRPKRVGVFVDYNKGLVSFYDADSADHLYSFTGCVFTERLYPFFTPCTNDRGVNSAPLIISPVNQDEQYERKKPELKSLQQFSVDVTLDPDTAHPNLILSEDRKQVHCDDVRQNLPDSPKRFNSCVNVLGKESFSSGRFYFEVQVEGKTAWTVGVAEESIKRRGNITLSPDNGFWTVWLKNGKEYMANDDRPVSLSLHQHPHKVGVFVDHEEGLVSFFDVDSADHLYSFTGCDFTERLYPFLSPCTEDHGVNSAPLIISPVNHDEDYERKKAELKSVQQFSVDVTLDPDTAHPNLILSDDGKQVHHGDVRKLLPESPERFNSCVNVLGKESFSSGRFYFEVQVEGKTAWTVGVAEESIKRRGKITLSPDNGFWTIWLRKGKEYKANDDRPVRLSLHLRPRKVGVFVDYEDGLVSFYDVEAADLLYTYTGCSFTKNLLPYISPCHNDNGSNSAPLIICPVNHND